MKTRIATKNDLTQIQQLLQYGFGYSYPLLQWNLEHNIDPNQTIVIEENQSIVSCASKTPYELALYGQYVAADYINAWTTSPLHRRRGYGMQALYSSMTDTRAKGGVLCFSVPSDYTLMQKYGFRVAYQFKQYRFSPDDLPDFHVNGDISFITLSHIPYEMLNMIYERFMADKNAYPKRTAKQWKLILEDLFVNFDGKAVILIQNGMAAGYLFYLLHDDTMYIYEAAYVNTEAQQSLLGFMKNHSTQISKISMKAVENDLTNLYFCNRRDAVTLCPFAAARVVNVQAALWIIAPFVETPFTISVTDPLIPENNTAFFVEHTSITVTDKEPDLILDIGTFTQLFTGFLGISDAARLGLVLGSIYPVESIFGKRTNYINMLCM